MVRLDGGWFLMGSEDTDVLPEDGEGPVRSVWVDPFYASKFPVTNSQFREFTDKTGYLTDAERFGWTFVFKDLLQGVVCGAEIPTTPWWYRIEGASWKHPFGPDSTIGKLEAHPVVHVSFHDAQAYAAWSGTRLPTEAEWEYAARGGLEQATYPWGDNLLVNGKHMCNIWQGAFPSQNTLDDGYLGTAPVNTFAPNGYGLYTVVGNSWEWCGDFFHPDWHVLATRTNPVGPPTGNRHVLRGGSYLCHHSYCRRYRNSARTGNSADTSAGNIGFRVVRDI